MTKHDLSLPAIPFLLALAFASPGDAQVLSHQKISNTDGGLVGPLAAGDRFGVSVAPIGDLDGDGVTDIAVGAFHDDVGGHDVGSVWVLFMNTDGTVKAENRIGSGLGGFTGVLGDNDRFGISVCPLGDLDGDGILDLAVGARGDGPGGPGHGAVWLLYLHADGTVKSHGRITTGEGGFMGQLSPGAEFGEAVRLLGDLDQDGVIDLAVSGRNTAAVWILFMNSDGTVRAEQEISETQGGFTGSAVGRFGSSLGAPGDIDGDGFADLVVGAPEVGDGGIGKGRIWILFLSPSGTVLANHKISATGGGFTGHIGNNANFGTDVDGIGDIDGDGIPDIAVSAFRDSAAGPFRGVFWILSLNASGTVKANQMITEAEGGFLGDLDDGDSFGTSLSLLGDLDGDGYREVAVGAYQDDDGAGDAGAVWILTLDDANLASSLSRNGTGFNPTGFSEVCPAVAGGIWKTFVDIFTPGAIGSIVAISTGGPVSGMFMFGTIQGELLCMPPFLPFDVAFGAHGIPIPNDPALLGQTLCTQAATVRPDLRSDLQNAIDITIGEF